jgi:uncharacterized LabA/DUF88 family protein
MSIIKRDKNERVMVFIDLSNIESVIHGLKWKGIIGAKMDYEDLVAHLVGERILVAAYVFDSCAEDDPKRKFLSRLQRIGFRADIRNTYKSQTEQKEVDVALATRLLSCAFRDQYDTAVVISGDRDFIPAIEEVQLLGKKVEVASFRGSSSYGMETISDVFTCLSELCIIDITECRAAYGEKTENCMAEFMESASNGGIA